MFVVMHFEVIFRGKIVFGEGCIILYMRYFIIFFMLHYLCLDSYRCNMQIQIVIKFRSNYMIDHIIKVLESREFCIQENVTNTVKPV